MHKGYCDTKNFLFILDAEMVKYLKEAIERNKKLQEERDRELAEARIEYDAIHEGLSTINFHLPLFFTLIILTALNIPSAIIWAKNYNYTKILDPDPSLIPAVVAICALSFIWQLSTPKNISGYKVISFSLYALSAISVLYCQNSVYRLNAFIPPVFVTIALHQIFGRKTSKYISLETPEQIELREKIEKIKQSLNKKIDAKT